jgi:hypothetical protein
LAGGLTGAAGGGAAKAARGGAGEATGGGVGEAAGAAGLAGALDGENAEVQGSAVANSGARGPGADAAGYPEVRGSAAGYPEVRGSGGAANAEFGGSAAEPKNEDAAGSGGAVGPWPAGRP